MGMRLTTVSQELSVARTFSMALLLSLAAGCQTMGTGTHEGRSLQVPLQTLKALESSPQSAQKRLMTEGLKHLARGDYGAASHRFNSALKLDVTQSSYHLLNAMTYHLMATSGDGGKYAMAEEGYRLALKFDASDWLAHYYAGLCALDQRNFIQAQQRFSRAVALENRDPDLLYDLAVASYHARDPRIAQGALHRLAEVAPDHARHPKVLRAKALIHAALSDSASADQALAHLRAQASSAEQLPQIERRLSDWRDFYRLAQTGMAGMQPVQFGGEIPGLPPAAPIPPPVSSPTNTILAGPFVDEKMVIVDVVLIGTQDDTRESYGINLLNGLNLQFGDVRNQTPAYTQNRDSSTISDSATNTSSNTLTHSVLSNFSVPAVSYTLNIANAIDGRNDVIAKPSLVALSGQASEFFSGVEISAAAVSGGAGDSISIQKEVGVRLSVKPDFLPDERVRLQVNAQRTFLTDPSNSVIFTFRLDTTKTNVNANVVLKFGETLVLSGLTEREVNKSLNGVPYLRRIPLLKNLFSQEGERDFQKSILILLTPRRPVYSAQAPTDRAALLEAMSEYERSVEKLELRHKDWFTPAPAFDEVRQRLQPRDFFTEFRSGDIKLEKWQERSSVQDHLQATVQKLI